MKRFPFFLISIALTVGLNSFIEANVVLASSRTIRTRQMRTQESCHKGFFQENSLSALVEQRIQTQSDADQFSTPQRLGLTFSAATLADSNTLDTAPPYTMGAVGPEQYVMCSALGIRSFDKKTGKQDHILDVTLESMFDTFNVNTGAYDSVFNPRIRYDQFSKRWWVFVANAINTQMFYIAFTDGPVIKDTTQWTFFTFGICTLAGTSHDSYSLGIDQLSLYIGCNNSGTTGFESATLVVIPKESLFQGMPFLTAFCNLGDPVDKTGIFAPQGVDNFDANPTYGHFIGIDYYTSGRLILYRVNNPGSTDLTNPPTLSPPIDITVPNYALPLPAPHLENLFSINGQINTNDNRLLMAHIRNSQLYTTQTIAVTQTGSSGIGGEDRDAARWYQIDLGNETVAPTVIQAGTLFDQTVTFTPRFFYYPSIMTNKYDDLTVAFTTSSACSFINAGFAGRTSEDNLNQLGNPVLYTKSCFPYNFTIQVLAVPIGLIQGLEPWGPYSYTSLDPCNEKTMWTIQEFTAGTDTYGLQVAQLLAPSER